MPLILQPTLTGISGAKNKDKHSVSFAYLFTGDTSRSVTIGGSTFNGSSYTLNVGSLPASVASLPAFRTLLLTQEFLPYNAPNFDGELFVSVSGVNQIFRFGGGVFTANSPNKTVLTAQVPIVANAPTIITFAKANDFGGVPYGLLNASIFDFDLEPFTYVGYANDSN